MNDDLIDRLQKATDSDPNLDFEISQAVETRPIVRFSSAHLHYTSSIDDALLLTPEWHKWSVSCGKLVQYVARISPSNGQRWGCFDGECDSTPAIALCIAALKARAFIAKETA